jgi:hypothetical protein
MYYQNILLPLEGNNTTEIDGIALNKKGIFVIESKKRSNVKKIALTRTHFKFNQDWQLYSDEDRDYMGEMKSPWKQNAFHCINLRNFLKQNNLYNLPIYNVVWFSEGKYLIQFYEPSRINEAMIFNRHAPETGLVDFYATLPIDPQKGGYSIFLNNKSHNMFLRYIDQLPDKISDLDMEKISKLLSGCTGDSEDLEAHSNRVKYQKAVACIRKLEDDPSYTLEQAIFESGMTEYEFREIQKQYR